MNDKANYMRRMRRIEGQARGIAKMIEDEKYCIDILTQISALTGAIQTVATGLLEDHMNHCVVRAARMSDEEAQAKIEEAAQAIRRLVRV
ncbi:metal-sensitive transcriptional regulator [Actinomycetaceae bacterium MB13-C1-2]|nr:metal-sensitive transcriptional regulator [Actinomycetaceae bacterium MB13-C1-2]